MLQCFYLTRQHRRALADMGAASYHVEQHEDETVYVPAGCPHQVTANSAIERTGVVLRCRQPCFAGWTISIVTSWTRQTHHQNRTAKNRPTAVCAAFAEHVALRQVRNLRSCIKVALDFVSPESLPQLEHLAGDRRALALQEAGAPDQKCAVARW